MKRSLFPMIFVLSTAFLLSACTNIDLENPADEAIPSGKSAPAPLVDPPFADQSDALTGEESVANGQQSLIEAGIQYHDGQVMLGTVGIYYIWYGNWSTNAKNVLKDLAYNIGSSDWWNIHTTYTNGAGTKLSKSASFLGGYQYTGASYSKKLSGSDIETIVTKTINDHKLAKNTSAVYVVLTSKDVDQVGTSWSTTESFGPDYCGWHTSVSLSGDSIKYAWVGDASQKWQQECGGQFITPNGQQGADGMANLIAHELTEAVTDPDGHGWYDGSEEENADKCEWNFGPMLMLPSGAKYNITLGSHKFLIQRNWVNRNGGSCAMGYSSTDECPNDPNKMLPKLCGCGKREPYNVAGFKDAKGFACTAWKYDDCTQAAEAFGYTPAQEAAILANCSASCGFCPSN
jgi:hypothetical protein